MDEQSVKVPTRELRLVLLAVPLAAVKSSHTASTAAEPDGTFDKPKSKAQVLAAAKPFLA